MAAVAVSRCTCLHWKPASVHSAEVKQAAEHVVAMLNNVTSPHAGLCARLRLDDVISAVRYVTSDHVLRFRRSSDVHGRVADFNDNMKQNVVRAMPLYSAFSYFCPSCDPVHHGNYPLITRVRGLGLNRGYRVHVK